MLITLKDLHRLAVENQLPEISLDCTELFFSEEDLFLCGAEYFERLLKSIPSSVTTLGFKDIPFSLDVLAELLRHTPSSITTLNLSYNYVGYIKEDNTRLELLITCIREIPESVTSLFLNNNYLNQLSGALLGDIFSKISRGIKLLSLAGNHFGSPDYDSIPVSELTEAFSKLPETVTALNLADNQFCYLDGERFNTLINGIPASIKTLDFSKNGLRSSLSLLTNVVSLNLSDNQFWAKDNDELSVIFKGIPNNVKTLDLSANGFERINAESLVMLKNSLLTVETIYLSLSEIKLMTLEQRGALREIFPTAKIIFVNEQGEKLESQSRNLTLSLFYSKPLGVGTLLEQCGLFVHQNKLWNAESAIPNGLKDYLKSFQ